MSDCPYCGKAVKDTDRFCLYCGEPLLKKEEAKASEESKSSSSAASLADRTSSKSSGSRRVLFSETENVPGELENKPADDKVEVTGKEAEAATPFVPEGAQRDMDPEIKQQIEARIEIYHLDKKIKKLKDRIAESLKLMDDPEFKKKYDLDDDFRKQNEVRFEALKQLGDELKKKKKESESKATKDFILEVNNQKIKRLKNQIEDLNNSFKMRKVDRKAYDSLHGEYMIQLTESIKQRDIHNIQLGMWASAMRGELQDAKHEANVLKARKSAKEISKEQLKENREAIQKKLETLEANIKIIESFIFKD
nr:zinc ribbon domain-containing protein [Candidatus Sigynarchaeota archaeon]